MTQTFSNIRKVEEWSLSKSRLFYFWLWNTHEQLVYCRIHWVLVKSKHWNCVCGRLLLVNPVTYANAVRAKLLVYVSVLHFTHGLLQCVMHIKTYSSVSAAKKTKKTCRTQVCYLLVQQSCQIQPYIYTTSYIKIEGNHFSSSGDICSKKLPIFFTFFFFEQNYKYI